MGRNNIITISVILSELVRSLKLKQILFLLNKYTYVCSVLNSAKKFNSTCSHIQMILEPQHPGERRVKWTIRLVPRYTCIIHVLVY